jgi:membrane-associated phospholipid phosphatase
MVTRRKELGYLLLWLLAGSLAVALVCPLDSQVDAAFDVTNDPLGHRIASWFTKLGEGWAPALLGIFFIVVYMRRHRPDVAAKIFFVILAGELIGLAGVIVRLFVGRTRPSAHVPQGFYGIWHDGHWIIGQFDYSAFPSGHTCIAVGMAAAAWLVHRGWGTVAALFAVAVAWSRVAFGSHHLSDVMASVVLAVPLAVILKRTLLPYLENQFARLNRSWQKEKSFAPTDPEKGHAR